ncbi:hypothetical protein VB776_07035 [Arcicella sp. DC2W]|uniref:Rieske domain-containing protein n=1 Tax=Arcicella gelida TaxID=2984195 RepID=A0ABU5S2I0_9BACT|nr:hypothetical protein [Arcicella sp. DC2W]MEA5402661.1 hypothetical protein [Arcicella sp. DC2W]
MKAVLTPIDETTQLTVGKSYPIRCAKMKDGAIIPLIGKRHADPELGVVGEHYHIDGRFFLPKSVTEKYQIDDEGRTNVILCADELDIDWNCIVELLVKQKKCVRLTTGVNPPSREATSIWSHLKGLKYYKWYDKFLGKEVKENICPHLGTKMIEQDGVLVCPLHNLKACKKSKLIIK